eukprot:CAMPEP_0170513310 /NCGR_PEP_ID=MMETSP0208-20121228/67334_1 /TAXON_ID=197538 /ORGANISM="Strombidium inclinatum, Strain S3" /LENGTH=117 /DNA_ID=CAMNT_0010797035 /DNA_START=790 /DNA_END=1139 /DNA_ORIENTATION=-
MKSIFLQTGGETKNTLANFGGMVSIPNARSKGGNSNMSLAETEELYRNLSSKNLKRHPLPESSSFQSHSEDTHVKVLNFKNRVKTQHKIEQSQSTSHLEAKSLMSLNQIANIGDRNA